MYFTKKGGRTASEPQYPYSEQQGALVGQRAMPAPLKANCQPQISPSDNENKTYHWVPWAVTVPMADARPVRAAIIRSICSLKSSLLDKFFFKKKSEIVVVRSKTVLCQY